MRKKSDITDVQTQNKTVEYGDTVTAKDLVTNSSAYPAGTTFEFADNSEPDWTKPGVYTVKIKAHYPSGNVASNNFVVLVSANGVTEKITPYTEAQVAVNDSKVINVAQGSTVPAASDVLPTSLPDRTATWTKKINTDSSNEGEITVHYNSGKPDQVVKIYTNVVPKFTDANVANGKELKSDGTNLDGSQGQVKNGYGYGSDLINTGNYQSYVASGNQGTQQDYSLKTGSYGGAFAVSGLKTNSDGSLVSGDQTATVKVYLPSGVHGSLTGTQSDEHGDYYTLNANVEVAQKVTFEFVNDFDHEAVVGQTYTQDLIPGKEAKLNFTMSVPGGYQLSDGQSIPTSYTVEKGTSVVKVHVRNQGMKFYLSYVDDDDNGKQLADITITNPGWTTVNGVSHDYKFKSIEGVPSGLTIAGDYNHPFTDPRGSWWLPNYSWKTDFASEKALYGHTIVIHLVHGTQDITNTDSQAKMDTPATTVNFIDDATGQSLATDGQITIHKVRKATKDLITNQVTYGDWKVNTSQGTDGYSISSGSLSVNNGTISITGPIVDGYASIPTNIQIGADGSLPSTATVRLVQAKSVKVPDKTVYINTTFEAKELVSNTGDFPSYATFQFVNNSKPKWNQNGTYNVQITASYKTKTKAGKEVTVVTNPATAKVTVVSDMRFTFTYWDDTENKKIIDYAVSTGNHTYKDFRLEGKLPAGLDTGRYQSAGVSGVPNGVVMRASYWADLNDPTSDWAAPNFIWLSNGLSTDHLKDYNNYAGTHYTSVSVAETNKVAKSLFGANIIIHLKHKTEDLSNTDVAKQTRQITVNYKKVKVAADGTYAEDGKAFDSAVLDVYYHRTATKDLVTGKTTYGEWQWDTSQGGHGYHVVSGKWTNLPQNQSAVVADVPTLAHYTVYTGGPAGNTVPANEFVDPTWNGTTDTSKGSTAYTSDAKEYQAQAVHTIYYVPNELETRTVTRNFKYAGTDSNLDGTDAFPPAQIQVFFMKAGTLNINTGKVTYAQNWTWDTTSGDENTPGFKVLSGSWSGIGSKGKPAGAPFSLNAPNKDGYTTVTQTGDASYNGDSIASPKYQNDNLYRDNTNNIYFWTARNNVTIYYVPNSKLSKTFTRTIVIHDPDTGTIRTVPQNVTFTRTAKINSDDTGIVYGSFTGNDQTTFKAGDNLWNHPAGQDNASGTWPTLSSDNIVKPGYTAFINGKAVTEVPAETVTPDTKDTTLDVTYIKNDATITISGADQTKIYDGQPATITDDMANAISHQINADAHLTLPNGTDQVKLTKDDFSIAGPNSVILSGNPTNVGEYRIVLNDKGLAKFTGLDSNFTWNYDAKTSYVNLKIVQSQANSVTFSAEAQKTYDGSNVLNGTSGTSFTSAPSIVIAGADGKPLQGLNNYTFQSGDFEFVDKDGNVTSVTISPDGQITGPVNAGKYTIRLTQAGLGRIAATNPNVNFTNVQVANTGSGTLTIEKYAPRLTLSGKGSKTYDGQVASSAELIKQDGDNTITIKLTVPKQGGGMVVVPYTFSSSMDYSGDYAWYSNGTAIDAPKNAGTYTIKLKADQVKTILQDLIDHNSNFSYLKGNVNLDALTVSGEATYQIKQKPLMVYLSGHGSTVYTGGGAEMPLQDLLKSLTADGLVQGETLGVNTFDKADFQWYVQNTDGTFSVFNGKDAQGNPVQTPINVGTYYIGILPSTDTNSGIDTLKRDNVNYDVTIDYSKYYQFDITKATGTMNLSGNQTDTYNGTSHTVNGYTLTVNGAGLPNNQVVALNPGDLEFSAGNDQWTATVPVNAGRYQVRLAQKALDDLSKEYANLTWNRDDITNSAQDYVVNPTQVTVTFQGGPTHQTYNGSPLNIEYSKDNFMGRFAMNGVVAGETINTPELTSGLFEWVDTNGHAVNYVPTNAGNYTLKLKNLDNVNSLNKNYHFVFAKDASGKEQNGWSWIIDKATATINFANGSGQQIPWTGQATVLNPNNFGISIITNNGQTLAHDALTVDDFQFYQDGSPIDAPTEVGNYTVKLKDSALAKIEKDTANYTWTDNASSNYVITKAAATISLSGSSEMTYNGQAASFPLNSDGSIKGITVTLSNGQTYTLKNGDLAFAGQNGDVTDAPTNAGTYKVTLSRDGLANINKVDGEHYQYTLAKDSLASFEIKKADATIALSGSGNHIYNGHAAQTSEGSYTIQLPGQTTATPVDAGNLVFVGDPTNAGSYEIALSDAYKQQLQNTYGNNYNLTYSNGTFTVDPQEVSLILNGYASQDYNGQPAKITDVSNLKLTWGDRTTTTAPGSVHFTLTPDDLEVVDANGKVPTEANGANPDAKPYYVKLKESILTGLNSQNNNYTFKIGDTFARYTIKSKDSNATLSGSQFVDYGGNSMPTLDGKKFTFTWTNAAGQSQNISITANDLEVEVPEGVKTDANGLPLSAGQYVVKVKQSVIDKLNKDNPNYYLSVDTSAWYVVRHRAVSFTITGTPSAVYNGQAAQIKKGDYSINFSGVLNGDQSVFNNIQWDASDFAFVNGAPTNAGTYQVHLSKTGLQKLNDFAQGATGSNYDFSSVATVENGQITASSVTADYTIKQNQLTLSLTDKDGKTPSSSMGYYDLNAGDYTLTITPQEQVSGQNFTYTLQDGDLAYVGGIPANVGTYQVHLTDQAIQKIKDLFGTKNFTYNPATSASREITQGQATITISGGQHRSYTGKPATLNHKQYTATVSTGFLTTSVDLEAGDMKNLVFYTKGSDGKYKPIGQEKDRPTNAGTYYVGLNQETIKRLKEATGNNGNNYTWTEQYATYVIRPVNRTATGSFGHNSDYNGQPIAKQTITVKAGYPGATNATYTLQDGDYQYVDAEGKVVANPTEAGTYTIQLTDAGKKHIQQLGNVVNAQGNTTTTNVNWTIDFNGSYTINKVRMTVTVSGTQNETYNKAVQTINIGGDNGINVNLSVNGGLTAPTIPTTGANALTASDFTVKDDQGHLVKTPTNAGHYKVYLNASGLAKLGNLSPNFTVPASLDQAGNLNIARKEVNVAQGTAGKTFDAQSAALSDDQFAQYKQAITDAGYNADKLTIDGIDWWFDDSVDYGTQGSLKNPVTGNPIKDIGTYNLRLNAKGQKEIDDANPNYQIKVGDFKFTIYPEVVHINISGEQDVAWDNQGVAVDPTKFLPTFTVYGGPDGAHPAAGTKPIANPVRDDGQALTLPAGVQLVPGDYEFVDDQGNVISSFTGENGRTSTTPFKVGTYKVRLTEAGWKKLTTQSTDNVHYQYDGSTGMLNIQQITTPKIMINGANWKTYDGQAVSYSELVSEDPVTHQPTTINVSITSNGHTITFPLNDGDYLWTANGQTLSGAPTNAGTYAVTLNKDKVVKSLQAYITQHPDFAGALNLDAGSVDGSALFEIRALNVDQISADIKSNKLTASYDGSTKIDLSTLANAIQATDSNGNVLKLNTSGLTLNDFTMNGNSFTSFPVNVGTYTFRLNAAGIRALQDANPNLKISNTINNVNSIFGVYAVSESNAGTTTNDYSYILTINPAPAHVTLGGDSTKTYDGQPATTAEINAGTSTVSVKIDANKDANKTVTYTLQDGDYDWYDQAGNKLDKVPTDVGTYTIKLNLNNDKVLAHLKEKIAADPEWTVKDGAKTISNVVLDAKNISGSATFTISRKDVTLTVTGNQTSPDLSANPQNFTVSGTGADDEQITIGGLTADDFEYIDAHGQTVTTPAKSGNYQVVLTAAAQQKIQQQYSNYKFNFSSNGTMSVQANLTVNFVDTETGNKVVQTQKFAHMVGTQINLNLTVPAGYVLDDNSAPLTMSYKYTDDLNPTMTFNLKHKRVTINSDSPSTKVPIGKVPGDPSKNFDPMENLIANPTRTINVTDPYGITKTTTQSVEFTRTATFDLATGKIKYSDWVRKGGQSAWDAFDIPHHDGYTTLIDDKDATSEKLDAKSDVNATTPSQTVNITYNANPQSMTIEFVDDDANGKQVGQGITMNGVTGKTITDGFDKLTVPENYELAKDQTLPQGYTFTAAKDQSIVIHLVEKKSTVTDPSQLTKTITRTITINVPGREPQIVKQTAHFTRTGQHNEATGKNTYTGWILQTNSLFKVNVPIVAGYTPSQTVIEGINNPTADMTLSNIVVNYTANEQTVTIRFVDDDANGQQVGADIVKSGKTDQTITQLGLTVPTHYQLANGQKLPSSYTFNADGDQTITIHLIEDKFLIDPTDSNTNPYPWNPNWFKEQGLVKEITRTIIDKLPNGTKQLVQTTTLHRTATYNAVTGQLTDLGDWSNGTWNTYSVNVPAGYTSKINQNMAGQSQTISAIDAEDVTADMPDQVITISYVRKQTPTKPTNPTNPTQPTRPTSPTTPGQDGGSGNGGKPVDNNSTVSGSRTESANGKSHSTKQLPQTGDSQHKADLTLGLAFAAMASSLGIAGFKKKKEDK